MCCKKLHDGEDMRTKPASKHLVLYVLYVWYLENICILVSKYEGKYL